MRPPHHRCSPRSTAVSGSSRCTDPSVATPSTLRCSNVWSPRFTTSTRPCHWGHGAHWLRSGILRRVGLPPRLAGERIGQAEPGQHGPFGQVSTPIIGAINGPAVTGGLELALACDMLLASTRATFADTHARVGIMPGWGMSVLLPAAVGQRRAVQMSLSGNYVDADTALAWGLVNAVVPHDQLLATAVALAGDIAGADPAAVGQLLALYRRTTSATTDQAWDIEAATSRAWWREHMDRSAVGDRASSITDRDAARPAPHPADPAAAGN